MRDWIECECQLRIVIAGKPDRTFLRFVEPAQKIDDCGLTATSRAYQGDRFSSSDGQAQIGQDRFAILVIEIHMVKLDIAGNGLHLVLHRPGHGLRGLHRSARTCALLKQPIVASRRRHAPGLESATS